MFALDRNSLVARAHTIQWKSGVFGVRTPTSVYKM